MIFFTTQVRRVLCEENGVTAIEYALIASLIAVVIVGAVTSLGITLQDTYAAIANALP
jgi:pilus assembly protein Flp/PilA